MKPKTVIVYVNGKMCLRYIFPDLEEQIRQLEGMTR